MRVRARCVWRIEAARPRAPRARVDRSDRERPRCPRDRGGARDAQRRARRLLRSRLELRRREERSARDVCGRQTEDRRAWHVAVARRRDGARFARVPRKERHSDGRRARLSGQGPRARLRPRLCARVARREGLVVGSQSVSGCARRAERRSRADRVAHAALSRGAHAPPRRRGVARVSAPDHDGRRHRSLAVSARQGRA